MMMGSNIRKFALTTHVSASVGWLGAVASFLALAIGGLLLDDSQAVRSAYLMMEFTTWFVIVPLSVASLATGLIQSLGTTWGLFRHYWVVAKLAVTVVATIILLAHTQPIGAVAAAAAMGPLADGDLRPVRVQLIADAVIAMFALVFATTLSVYKPFGLTAYGRRQAAGIAAGAAASTPAWARYVLWMAIAALVLFLLVHLAGGGMHRHG